MNSVIHSHLIEDEKILWHGKPTKTLSKGDYSQIVILMIWMTCVSLIFALSYFILGRLSKVHLVFAPFLFLGLFAILSVVIKGLFPNKNTEYYVTNKRLIIIKSNTKLSFHCVFLKDLTSLNCNSNEKGIGTIYANKQPVKVTFSFNNIKNAEKVYNLILNQKNVNSTIKNLLVQKQEINLELYKDTIWEGQPNCSYFSSNNDPLILFGFACNVTILGSIWVVLDSNPSAFRNPAILFGFSVFLIAGFLIMFVKPSLNRKRSINKKYTVTKSTINIYSKKTSSIESYSIKDIKVFCVQKNLGNTGSIYFNNLSKGNSYRLTRMDYNMESNTYFKNIETPIRVYRLIRQMQNNQGSTKVDVDELKLKKFSAFRNTLKHILLYKENIVWTCKPKLISSSKNKLRKKVFYIVTNLGIIIYIEKRSSYFKSILYSDLEKVELNKNKDGSGSVYFDSHLETFSYYRSRKDPYYYFKLCFYDIEDVDNVFNLILKQKELNDLKSPNYFHEETLNSK